MRSAIRQELSGALECCPLVIIYQDSKLVEKQVSFTEAFMVRFHKPSLLLFLFLTFLTAGADGTTDNFGVTALDSITQAGSNSVFTIISTRYQTWSKEL